MQISMYIKSVDVAQRDKLDRNEINSTATIIPVTICQHVYNGEMFEPRYNRYHDGKEIRGEKEKKKKKRAEAGSLFLSPSLYEHASGRNFLFAKILRIVKETRTTACIVAPSSPFFTVPAGRRNGDPEIPTCWNGYWTYFSKKSLLVSSMKNFSFCVTILRTRFFYTPELDREFAFNNEYAWGKGVQAFHICSLTLLNFFNSLPLSMFTVFFYFWIFRNYFYRCLPFFFLFLSVSELFYMPLVFSDQIKKSISKLCAQIERITCFR